VDEATSGPSEPTGPIECITAFVVYQLPNGLWQVSDDLDVPLMPERKCNGDDITAGAAITQRDAATREMIGLAVQQLIPAIVQNVINAQMQLGQAIRNQQQQEVVQQKLESDKQRRGGRG
jgi:hypothetical protein